MRRLLPILLLAVACSPRVYIGEGFPTDGGPSASDAGVLRDASVLDAGDLDAATIDLTGLYQLVYQLDPARVICTDEMAPLSVTFDGHTAPAAGLAGGVGNAVGNEQTLVLSGPPIEQDLGLTEVVLTQNVRRPFVYSGAFRVGRPGPDGTSLDVMTVQVERQDPESGILRGIVQQRFSRGAERGLCTVDYQLTLYACGVGC